MPEPPAHGARAWLPDLIYRDGVFESGLALVCDSAGVITGFSSDPAVLAAARRLPGRAMLPGLVNAHSHTFQRVIRGRTECAGGAGRDSFWTWRDKMYEAAGRLSPEDVAAASAMAFLEMLLAGITSAGEFHYLHHQPDGRPYDDPNLLAHAVIDAARAAGIRLTLLYTAYARAGFSKPANPRQARFLTPSPDRFLDAAGALASSLAGDPLVSLGLAPHSVRAVPLPDIRRIAAYARDHGLVLHMHASEQPAEIDECLAEHGRRPVELLADSGIAGPRFTAVHAIHITPQEALLLGRAGAAVCACPTTERNLGDGAVPARAFAAAHVPIALGSDSNVQIDLLEDARELEYHLRMRDLARAVLAPDSRPESLAQALFHCATLHGARSLGISAGALEPGRPADFFTVHLDDPSLAGAAPRALLSNIVFAAGRPAIREVAVAGRLVVENGRHTHQDSIVNRFRLVQESLWR